MKSIQARLNVGFIVFSTLAIGLLLAGNSMFLRQVAYDFVAARLASESFALLRSVEQLPNGQWWVSPNTVSQVYRQPMSGHYYQVKVGGRWFYSRSLWDEMIPTTDGEILGQENIRLVNKSGQPWLVLDQAFMRNGQKIHLVVAEDVSRIEKSLSRMNLGILLIAVVLLGGLLLVQVYVIRRGLSVLTGMKRKLNAMRNGEIKQLPAVETTEVAPLVNEINYLVEAMHARLTRSRRAVGNLAHAAKTPLTGIDRLIDRLAEQDPALAQQMSEQSERLRELISRELTRARIAGAAMPGQRVQLASEVQKLTRTLTAIYQHKGVFIKSYIGDTLYFPGERDDLLELLGNLLDNACKWATEQVVIRAHVDNGELVMVIEDDGPGIDEDQQQRLLDRGERLDESVDGHGLGLSIVKDIVSQYGGQWSMSTSEEYKGLRVTLRFAELAPA